MNGHFYCHVLLSDKPFHRGQVVRFIWIQLVAFGFVGLLFDAGQQSRSLLHGQLEFILVMN